MGKIKVIKSAESHWKPVPYTTTGAASTDPEDDFSNLIGFEELTDYTFDGGKLKKKTKSTEKGSSKTEKPKSKLKENGTTVVPQEKSKIKSKNNDIPDRDVPGEKNKSKKKKNKEVKASNEMSENEKDENGDSKNSKKKRKKKKKKGKSGNKVKKAQSVEEKSENGNSTDHQLECSNVQKADGDNIDEIVDNILVRMPAWNGLGVPSILLRALEEKSFTAPTKIQALTLPAAIYGRRDILGAAETGSGKTLAFGLPILNGILQELEKGGDEDSEEDGGEGIDASEGDVQDDDESNNEEMNNSDVDEDFDNSDMYKDIENSDVYKDIDNSDIEDKDNSDMEEDIGNSDMEENINNPDEEDMENTDMEEGDSDAGSIFDLSEEVDDSKTERGNIDDKTKKCVYSVDNVADFPTFADSKEKSRYISKPLYALVLTPTRELAVQISQHLKTAAKYTPISVAVVVGGLAPQKQERLLNRGPEIVVATPGRLWELIEEGHPHLAKIDKLRFLAIDETDRMLEKGHFEELERILEKVNTTEANMKKRQNFVFSATLTLTHGAPRYVLQKGKKKKRKAGNLTPVQKLSSIMETVGLTNPKVVDITEGSGVAQGLREAQIICNLNEKDNYLYYFLQRHPGRTLVFCNSIEAVRRLTKLFTLLECSPRALHAKMIQKQRLRNLERFRDDPRAVLLATDVAARGLDIPNVQHVIHYQTPRTAESYVHRSGRTARAEKVGLTVLFIEPSEVSSFTRIFKTLGRDANLPTFPVQPNWFTAAKERINLARKLDTAELQAMRVNKEQSWLDKMVEEMDMVVSDDELPTNYSRKSAELMKKQAAALRKQLTDLLSKPLIPKGMAPKSKLVVPLCPGSMVQTKAIYQENAVQALKSSVEEEKALKRKMNNERTKVRRKLAKRDTTELGGSPQTRLEESDN